MIKYVHIYDIDGVLIDSTHRYKTIKRDNGTTTIDFPYWESNRHRAMHDKLLPMSKHYQKMKNNADCFVICATARNMHEEERKHIKTVLGWPDYMIARRNNDDKRSGADLKIQGLLPILSESRFDNAIKYFYEDNLEYLVKVSNALGLTAIYIPSKQGY